jgi:hypothetical protein
MFARSAVLAAFAACLLPLGSKAADVDPLLPDGSRVVLTVHVRQLLDSALVKKHGAPALRKVLQRESKVEKFLIENFRPENLTTLTVALGADIGAGEGAVILRGKFEPARIAEHAESLAKEAESGLKVESIAGTRVIAQKVPAGWAYLAVLDAHSAVETTDRAVLKETLEKHAGKRKAALNKELKRQIEAVAVGRTAWLVADAVALRSSPLAAADDKAKDVLDRLRRVSMDVTVTDGVAARIALDATDETAARSLRKDIDGSLESAKAVVALVADNRPELAPLGDLLGSLVVKTDGTVLRLEVAASASVLERILKTRK